MIGWDKKPEIGQYFQGTKIVRYYAVNYANYVSSSILSLVYQDSDPEDLNMADWTFIVSQNRKTTRGNIYLARLYTP